MSTDKTAQAIIDQHMKTLLEALEEADLQPVGVVVGVMCGDKTSTSWCIKNDVKTEDDEIVPIEVILSEIVVDIQTSLA
jgi:hypothetical protein